MRIKLRSAASGAIALGLASALVLGAAAAASAATPPYEPDTVNQYGQLVFYDASGNLVTGGNVNDAPFTIYAAATTDDPNVGHFQSAALYGYKPVNGVAPGAWSGEQLSNTTNFPVSGAPAPIASLGNDRPVVTMTSADLKLSDLISDFPNTAPSGDPYFGLYQIRVAVAGETKWWAADIQVTGTTWSLVYPSVGVATTTTLTASPSSPQTVTPPGSAPSAVTLTATPTSGVAGTVQFTRNGTNLGTPVTVAGGVATKIDTPDGPASGAGPVTTNYGAIFTPSDAPAHNGSSATPIAYVVQNVAGDATTTDLSISGSTGLAGTTVNLSSHVVDTTNSATIPVGSVSWYDNGSATPLNATPVAVDGTGHAIFTTGALAAGPHSIVATFTPTNAALFSSSSSSAGQFNLVAAGSPCADPASQCTDPQTIITTVDAGTLVISTPYTATNPFDLGHMALDSTGTFLHASGAFGTAADPTSGVTITDTRAGDLPWTASAYSGDFVSGSNLINGQNLGFTSVTPQYVSGNALNSTTKPVVTNDVPNSGPATIYGPTDPGTNGLKGSAGTQHTFATAAHGAGSVYVIGTLDLYAPTSTPAGTYTDVVTFTIA